MAGNFAQFWDFPLGPVYGEAGTVTTITIKPQCRFRVEKVMATDTGDPPGTSTGVMQFLVGNQLQRPVVGGATLVTFFGPAVLGNGVRWGICDRGLSIALTLQFIRATTFYGSLFGSAVA